MRISDLLKLSTDNLRRRKGRTALTVIGVVVGTCAIVVMISLGIATNQRTEEMLSTWSDLTQITVLGYSDSADTPALDDDMVKKFKSTEHVLAATPMYRLQNFDGMVTAGPKGRYETYAGNITGMEPDAMEPMEYTLLSGDYLVGHQRTSKKIPVLVGEDFAYNFEDSKKSWNNPNRYRYKETDANGNPTVEPFFSLADANLTLEMTIGYDDNGNRKTRDYDLEVVGIMKSDYAKDGSMGMVMSIDDMKWLETQYKKYSKSGGGGTSYYYGSGQKTGGYDQVYVKTDDVNNVAIVEKAIQEIGYNTYSMSQTREDMQKQVAGSQMMLAGLAAVSLLVAALNIANTMTMAIYERTKEIGVMKVLGCNLNKIRQMFLIESGAIGFIGGVIGAGVSMLLGFVLNHINTWMQMLAAWLMSMGVSAEKLLSFDIGSTLSGGMGGIGGMGGDASKISIIPPWLLLVALVFATVVGLLSGIAPANRAVKISALEAIRHE